MVRRRMMHQALVVSLLLATGMPALGQERGQAQKPRIQPQPQVLPRPPVQPEPKPQPEPLLQPETQVQPEVSQYEEREKAAQFERLRQQALAAKSPGGDPTAESSALLQKLTAQHASRVESENARIQTLAKAISAGSRAGGQLGDPGDLPVDAGAGDLGLDPCGVPDAVLEVAAVQALPPLDPGESVIVEGCGLGIDPGELRLVGDFPSGHVDLKVSYWSSRSIIAQLPLVTGVGDMPAAMLQVVRQDGKLSNLLDVGGFRAMREVKLIHPTDVVVTCASYWGAMPLFSLGPPYSDCTLAKNHAESQSFAAEHGMQRYTVEDCNATESWEYSHYIDTTDLAGINLNNGWVLAGYAWWWTHAGDGFVQLPAGFNVNASSTTVAMKWGLYTNPCDPGPTKSSVQYRVDFYAVGPKGVPYK